MKKLICVILSVCMLCSVWSISAYAADAPAFELSDAQGDRGDTLNVKLYVRNNPGVTALRVTIAYSTDDLELVGVKDGGLFDSAISKSELDKTPAVISWFAADSKDKTESGLLATLTFEVKEKAKNSFVALSYDEDDVINEGMKNVSFETNKAMITVYDAPEETTEPDSTEAQTATAPSEQETTSPETKATDSSDAAQTTAPQTSPSETQSSPKAYKTLCYIPTAEQESSGCNYKLTIKDRDGVFHEYEMTPSAVKQNGLTVYTASVPADEYEPESVVYQVYSGETWLGQVTKTVSSLDELNGVAVGFDGTETKLTELPTNPTDEPANPTFEPTEPATSNPSAVKKSNPIKVTVKKKTVSVKKLKKKAQKVKPLTIKNAKGKVSCTLKSVPKKLKKLTKINSKGVITIKRWKKAKKGTYKIKVKISAKGNANYKSKTITKTVKIKIK